MISQSRNLIHQPAHSLNIGHLSNHFIMSALSPKLDKPPVVFSPSDTGTSLKVAKEIPAAKMIRYGPKLTQNSRDILKHKLGVCLIRIFIDSIKIQGMISRPAKSLRITQQTWTIILSSAYIFPRDRLPSSSSELQLLIP